MNTLTGKLTIAAAYILAGSSVVAARSVTDYISPFTITFLSLLIAVATAVLLDGRGMLTAMRRSSPARRRMLFLQAFFGIFLFRILLTYGLLRTSAAEAGIITGTAPAITAVFTILLLREPFTFRCAAGVCMSAAGIMALQGFPFQPGSIALSHLVGNGMILAATACESFFSVVARKMHLTEGEGHLSPVTQAGLVSLIALVLCAFPLLSESPAAAIADLPAGAWLALLWYGAVVTVLAFACMFFGVKRCDGYTISAFTGLMPLSALILSILFLGEAVSWHHALGCGCILLSIWIIGARRPEARRAASSYPCE